MLRPQSVPPSTCASAPSGSTTVPASTTIVSFSTTTPPLPRSTRTRATQATQVGISRSCPNVVATPSPESFGMAAPQSALLQPHAEEQPPGAWLRRPNSGPSQRYAPVPSSSLERKATGSAPAACAASSMNVSTAQLVQPGADRAQPAGPEGAVGHIVRQRADTLRADSVPMVRAVDRKWDHISGRSALAP